ncbi:MAG: glycosyltransferase [Desulfobulbaceae bacterium]|jgi:glycosyltransferase involved in cell wall biosynthesis|nr:glycosyltransferase [Desulfobulbaceae bacterium]HKJ13844.1 glycosyltransferase [Desulfobulbales bacterium]
MSRTGRFSTAMRDYARRQIEQLGNADIVVGIPSYYSDESLDHVIRMVAEGLDHFYPEKRSLIIVADGGSTDDTREVAQSVDNHHFNMDILVTIYRGIPGKGSAFRAIFEAAKYLQASAIGLFDSDLKSIKPGWVRNIIDPVLNGYDFVAPDYSRYKFDGTITNTIAYNLTRALYGVNIRQPIGGDFGMSRVMVNHCLDQDVWDTDIAKFGVDIWLTITAITGGFRICQAKLGAKIHGEKDPAADLGPMFREVVGTIFTLLGKNKTYLEKVKETINTPIFGEAIGEEPEAFEVNLEPLVQYFRIGFKNFGSVWANIIEEKDYITIKKLAKSRSLKKFNLPTETWVRIVYRYAEHFCRAERQRFKILDTLIPLYNARVASLIMILMEKNHAEAEEFYDGQAQVFESKRNYLIELLKNNNKDS